MSESNPRRNSHISVSDLARKRDRWTDQLRLEAKGKDRWGEQINLENGSGRAIRQLDDNTFEETLYSMNKSRYKVGIFFVPLDENLKLLDDKRIFLVSLDLDQIKREMDLAGGFAEIKGRKNLTRDEFKKRYGIDRIEEKLSIEIEPSELGKLRPEMFDSKYYEPTAGVVSPSLETLDETEKYLEKGLRVIDDYGKDEKIVFSPIPVVDGQDLITPYSLSSFNPFQSKSEEDKFLLKNILDDVRRERLSWYNVIQADRNSICPEEPNLCEDYVTYCNWLSGLEGTLRHFRGESSYVSSVLAVRDMKRVMKQESFRMGFSLRYRHPMLFDKDVLVEEVFGNFFARSRTFPCSLHETLAISGIDAAIDTELIRRKSDKKSFSKYPLFFHQIGEISELKSRIYDPDPKSLRINNKTIGDLGMFASDFTSLVALGFKERTGLFKNWLLMDMQMFPLYQSIGRP